MVETFEKIVGPRAPMELLRQYRLRYLLPSLLLALAAFCLLVSIFVPYWRMTLLAPQYPGGLQVQVYVDRMTGDVREIDGLNHYIGMRPLGEAAHLERSLSIIAIAVLSLLVVAAIFIHSRWAALLALPALLFPALFLGDLAFWLRNFGQNLDPRAPLSNAIKPFVPPVLGEGVVGQFRTVAMVERGFYLAILASCLVLLGLYFHRRAYKPLVEAARHEAA
jgi:copper chaperone NosL